MNLKKNISKLFLLLALISAGSCETFDLDQTENPSTLPQSFLDPIYSFNYVQFQLPQFVDATNRFTQRVTRQMAMTGGNSYDNAFSPELFDTQWTTGYLMLNAIKQMEPRAVANNQTFLLGASKVIRCYVLMTLVDMYGDIPYSQALQGNDNLTPAFDSSAAVYAGVYGELNQAITLLETTNPISEDIQDLYYGDENLKANPDSWVKLAKTLKLKMLNTARITGITGYDTAAEANALIAENDLINSVSEDFAFKYGTERDLPNSRHPDYNNDYEFGGGPFIGNYFMWAVSREKNEPVGGNYPYFDIRTQYYFYRQVPSSNSNSQILPCEYLAKPDHYNNEEYYSFYHMLDANPATAIEAPYCTTNLDADGTSFWGRDHGDDSGIPQDELFRTVHGIYPAGGKFGLTATPVSNRGGVDGALGQGIMPIMLSSWTKFIKAELALMVPGVAGDARALMLEGIDDSVLKVTTFLPDQAGEPSQSVIDTKKAAYKTLVGNTYNTATTEGKLEILVKEFYVASWGNGIEGYNNYRRTGYPSNMQPTKEEISGAYYYTALYPAVSVNNNPNAPANVRTRKVFWESTVGLNLH